MPIYEYECARCGRIEEVFQKFSDKPLTRCKKCSGKLHKLISQSSFHLKGSGWYATDYANSSAAGKAASAKTHANKAADKETSPPQKKESEAAKAPPSIDK